jgi:hypothetical protein
MNFSKIKILLKLFFFNIIFVTPLTYGTELKPGEFRWADVPAAVQEGSVGNLVPGVVITSKSKDGKDLLDYLNSMANFIDSDLRKNSKFYDFTGIPSPHVMVLENPALDAISTNAPICLNVNVRFNNSKPKHLAKGLYLAGDLTAATNTDPRSPQQGSLQIIKTVSTKDCVQRLVKPDEVTKLVDFINHYSSCKVTSFQDVNETGLQFNSCTSASELSAIDGSTTLVINVASNWVTFTTGMLSALDSDSDVLYILSHEMSHFYRAHLVARTTDYGYFFKEDSLRKAVPKPALDQSTYGWAYDLSELMTELRGYNPINFGQFPHALPSPLILPAIEFASDTDLGLTNVCKSVRNFKNDSRVAKLFGSGFPRQQPAVSDLNLYKNFEDDLLACLETIPISTEVISAQGSVAPYLIQQYFKKSHTEIRINQTKLSDMKNLKEVFLYLAAQVDLKIMKVSELSKKEEQNVLGHYSFEQDADEQALRTLQEIGVSGYFSTQSTLKLGLLRQKELGKPYGIANSAEECLAMINLDKPEWHLNNNQYIHLVTVIDPHHDHCHRAKNLFDRSVANGYLLPKQSSQSLPFNQWPSLLAKVKVLNGVTSMNSKVPSPPVLNSLKTKGSISRLPVQRLPAY